MGKVTCRQQRFHSGVTAKKRLLRIFKNIISEEQLWRSFYEDSSEGPQMNWAHLPTVATHLPSILQPTARVSWVAVA